MILLEKDTVPLPGRAGSKFPRIPCGDGYGIRIKTAVGDPVEGIARLGHIDPVADASHQPISHRTSICQVGKSDFDGNIVGSRQIKGLVHKQSILADAGDLAGKDSGTAQNVISDTDLHTVTYEKFQILPVHGGTG